MLKMTRVAALAAALFVAAAAVVPQAAFAQTPAPAAAPAEATAPAAAPAPAAKAAAKSTELVDNPYGLQALLKGSDIVARVTLFILFVMSAGSWYYIITKVYEQSKMGKHARVAEKTFWSAESVQKGAEGLKKNSPYRYLAETGL